MNQDPAGYALIWNTEVLVTLMRRCAGVPERLAVHMPTRINPRKFRLISCRKYKSLASDPRYNLGISIFQ